MTRSSSPPPDASQNKARVMSLGPHWVAVVLPDGSVLMQHLSTVPVCGTDRVFDLVRMQIDQSLELADLTEIDPERFAVRTLLLSYDGSVLCDPDGISPKGELSEAAFTMLSPTIHASAKYFARNTGKGDW